GWSRGDRAAAGVVATAGLLHPPGGQVALGVLHHQDAVGHHRRTLDRGAARALAGGELAVVQAQPVQVALEIAHHHIVPVHGDPAQVAPRQAGLLPYRAAGTAVQGPDRTVPVGHQHPVDRQPRTAGTAAVAGPDRTPAGGIDGHGGLLVAAGVEHGAVEHRSAVDVGHAV